ncbi:hypothetical protein LX32DRAFT_690171 [Colletotrichum zoysiae]|uniref:Uncharacterized protein n=1 Tax=Colletotrichum zoysiae TaxID=1216348 RepID=A0AAD9HT73_9PEZI|nr:hypothetical protein LX32DRAFT_690171 [Colletotrichum zoysiae]
MRQPSPPTFSHPNAVMTRPSDGGGRGPPPPSPLALLSWQGYGFVRQHVFLLQVPRVGYPPGAATWEDEHDLRRGDPGAVLDCVYSGTGSPPIASTTMGIPIIGPKREKRQDWAQKLRSNIHVRVIRTFRGVGDPKYLEPETRQTAERVREGQEQVSL